MQVIIKLAVGLNIGNGPGLAIYSRLPFRIEFPLTDCTFFSFANISGSWDVITDSAKRSSTAKLFIGGIKRQPKKQSVISVVNISSIKAKCLQSSYCCQLSG